jgi:hypothetical protein
MKDFFEYAREHPEAENSVSPGGAAAALKCDRPYVYRLVSKGKLRAWTIYDKNGGSAGYQGINDTPPNEKASVVLISWDDIRAYMASPKDKGGRPIKNQEAA